jgi:hypothetical protein
MMVNEIENSVMRGVMIAGKMRLHQSWFGRSGGLWPKGPGFAPAGIAEPPKK